ncbi:pentapeptide repeat-containing protein [Roseivirga sp. BDSF3-8]|uniref:pentapeptide repeat-containing protein n=1 Tax=Roseivirga sp. BDSF3-8 TaxID=3241598 RepID=UPI0035324BC3
MIKAIFSDLSEKIHSVSEKPILTTLIVLVLLAFVVIGLSLPYYLSDFKNFYGQVLAEAHGMLFDIAVIGILIFWLTKNGERRQRVRMFKDEIDDFRLWESEEAAFRTTGNVKRLNRHGIYEINLVNCYLARTNLNYVNLVKSNLNYANLAHAHLIECKMAEARLNQTNMSCANLNQADLSGAYASGADFSDAFMIKVVFRDAYLIKANLKNAYLMEADLRGADLSGANFDSANLYKADLRGAKGLSIEQFADVKSLYLARFDEGFEARINARYPGLLDGSLEEVTKHEALIA